MRGNNLLVILAEKKSWSNYSRQRFIRHKHAKTFVPSQFEKVDVNGLTYT